MGNKARRSAAGKPCSLRLIGCSYDPDTTVLAHIRVPGTGIGRKPVDTMAVYACHNCHDIIDGRAPHGMMDKELKQRIICGLAETHQQMIDEGVLKVR